MIDSVYLYVLMRNDLDSLIKNPGKMAAQSTHAANKCIFDGRKKENKELISLIDEWENQTNQGFGTCIVLAVKEKQMRDITAMAKELGYHADIVNDPTYPLQDGDTLHLISLDTCAYVFCRKNVAKTILYDLSLMP